MNETLAQYYIENNMTKLYFISDYMNGNINVTEKDVTEICYLIDKHYNDQLCCPTTKLTFGQYTELYYINKYAC